LVVVAGEDDVGVGGFEVAVEVFATLADTSDPWFDSV
jgi:hypothetical protein